VTTRVRIVGCGRWSMGDDQAGLVAARRVRTLCPQLDVCLTEEPLIELADGPGAGLEALFVIDAAPADDAHPAGTWTRIEYDDQTRIRLPEMHVAAHALGLPEALAVAERLGSLPPRVSLYLIFSRSFDRSLTISAGVSEAVEAVAESIAAAATALEAEPPLRRD